MNVNLPKKEKPNVKAVIIYTISIIACIIAIIVVILSYYYGSEELDRLITIGGSSITQSDIDYQLLVSGFDEIFQNQLEEYNSDLDIKKIDENQNLIYTYYTKNETEEKSYELNLNIPYINIDNETIAKYNDIAELLGVFRELNPEMPVINQYQFLIKMGMPQDVASLALSKTAINALDTPDVLAKFLLNQKTKEPGMLPPPDEMEGVGEAVAYKLTSKQYLKENYELGKQLKEFNDTMRTSLDKSLKESLLISKRKYIEGEE